jgi:hypothetical protein
VPADDQQSRLPRAVGIDESGHRDEHRVAISEENAA